MMVLVIAGTMPAMSATSGTSVGATVVSATTLVTSACPGLTSGITDFGSIMPGSSNVTTVDCAVQFGSSNDSSTLRVSQSDTLGVGMFRPANGVLDSTFDGDGRTTTGVGGDDNAHAMLVQPDGKVLTVGHDQSSGGFNVTLVRYAVDGSLDTTFDGDGIVSTPIGAGSDQAFAVALQPDGKILVGGRTITSNWDGAVLRYDANGTLDNSFSGDGIVTFNSLANDNNYVWDIALQPDGSVLTTGEYYDGSRFVLDVTRITPTGLVDLNFNGDGHANPVVGTGGDTGRAVLVQPDGRILVAGETRSAGGTDMLVIRLLPDGSLDPSFGAGGIRTLAIGTGTDSVYDAELLPDGTIVGAGQAADVGGDDMFAIRLLANGNFDPAFDSDGLRVVSVAGGNDGARSVARQADGKLLLGGFAFNGTDNDFAAVRLTSTGAPDATFGSSGTMTTPVAIAAGSETAYEIAIGPDGRTALAGSAAGRDFAVVMLQGTSVADYAPGTNWASGSATFGACLRALTGASVAAGWNVDPDANCTANDSDPWHAIAPTTGTFGTRLATTATGVTNAVASLRFGVRPATNQPPGNYIAPIVFTLLAPST